MRRFSVLSRLDLVKDLGIQRNWRLEQFQPFPRPADNLIIATAMAGGVDYIVTGDKRDLLLPQEAGASQSCGKPGAWKQADHTFAAFLTKPRNASKIVGWVLAAKL